MDLPLHPICVHLLSHSLTIMCVSECLTDHICPLNVAECKPGLAGSPLAAKYSDIMGFAQVHSSSCLCMCEYYGDQRQTGSLWGYYLICIVLRRAYVHICWWHQRIVCVCVFLNSSSYVLVCLYVLAIIIIWQPWPGKLLSSGKTSDKIWTHNTYGTLFSFFSTEEQGLIYRGSYCYQNVKHLNMRTVNWAANVCEVRHEVLQIGKYLSNHSICAQVRRCSFCIQTSFVFYHISASLRLGELAVKSSSDISLHFLTLTENWLCSSV